MTKYAMAIDAKNCTGCNSCTVACKMNNCLVPDVYYSYVQLGEEGEYPNTKLTVEHHMCNHCDNPPCVEICPVGATYKSPEGLVLVNAEECIGCSQCIDACPYGARTLVVDLETGYYDEGLTTLETAQFQGHTAHTVEKCTFCAPRLARGETPLCVQTCPNLCRYFGDVDDSESEISKILKERSYSVQLPEEKTKPRVYYLD